MYAIIKSGGKQYRVAVGDTVEVERLPHTAGEEITLSDVLMIMDGDQAKLDAQSRQGAQVIATVLGERKGKKVINFDYRNKHRRRTVRGHRQLKTRLEIKEIRV